MTDTQNNSSVAENYDEWAETYDTVQNRTRDLAAVALRQADLKLAGRSIVEVGCGTGRNTVWLGRPEAGVADIVGLDFSEGMLQQARARVHDARVRFVQHDVRNAWPLASNSVDVVIVMLVLEHVENLQPVFAEVARVLRPEGDLFISELHPERQMLGKQAEFKSAKSGELKRVEAFLHRTEDYLAAGKSAGLELVKQTDWHDDPPAETPRLLSVHFRKPGEQLL